MPSAEEVLLHISRIRNRAQALRLRSYIQMKDARATLILTRELIAQSRALRAGMRSRSPEPATTRQSAAVYRSAVRKDTPHRP